MRLTAAIIVAIVSVEAFAQTSEGLPKYLVPDLSRTYRLLRSQSGGEPIAPKADLNGITQIGLDRSASQSNRRAYSLVILKDGRVNYDGSYNVEPFGRRTGSITRLVFSKIANFVVASDWDSLETSLSGGNSEGDTTYISVTVDGRQKIVQVISDFGGKTPETFTEIGRLIDESLNNAQWDPPQTNAEVTTELAKGLSHAEAGIRWASAIELASVGMSGHSAINALIALLDDPNDDVRIEVLRALEKIRWKVRDHSQAIAALLEDDNPKIRSNAAAAIAASGSQDPALLPLLIQAMSDEDFNVHIGAADALSNFGPDAREAVPILMAELRIQFVRPAKFDPEANGLHYRMRRSVRSAVRALAKITPNDPDLVLALAELLGDPESPTRKYYGEFTYRVVEQAAILALKDMGPQAAAAVDAIVPYLKDDTGGMVNQPAADCLAAIGPLAASAIPALVDLVQGPASYPTPFAMTAIRKILGDSDETIEIMKGLMSHLDWSTRMYALKELGAIGPRNPNVVPILVEGINSDKEDVRRNSIYALGQVGVTALYLVPELKALLKSPDLILRTLAANALARLAPSDREVHKALIDLLSTSSASRAVQGLSNIRPPPRTALRALEATLDHESVDARRGAALVLLQMIPVSEKAQAFMIASLDNDYGKSEETRRQEKRMYTLQSVASAFGLHRLAPDKIVPALIAFAETDFYQAWIPEELAKYGELAAEALPLLEDMAEYADPETQAAAAKAIRKIRREIAASSER